MKNSLYLLFIIIFTGCTEPTKIKQEPIKIPPDSTGDKTYAPDSLEQAYLDGKIFYPNIVRLEPGQNWFIHTDSLFIETDVLYPENRESYYLRVMKMYPEELKKIHKICWQLPELQFQQGGDGGMYTAFTFIESLPTKQYPYYHVNIRRDYYNRQSPIAGMVGLRIHKTKKTIEMENTDGEYITLAYWREHGDQANDE